MKMKKTLILSALLLVTLLNAQVFNTAQTLRTGKFSLGLEPAIYDIGDNDVSFFIHGGYGINRGLDLGIKLGLGAMDETYFSADLEWMLRGLSPYISVSTGAHILNDVGIDGTLNITFPLSRQVWLYTGLDLDIIFADDTVIPLWIPVGLEVGIRRNMNLILEVEAGLNDEAYNIFGGGINFYF